MNRRLTYRPAGPQCDLGVRLLVPSSWVHCRNALRCARQGITLPVWRLPSHPLPSLNGGGQVAFKKALESLWPPRQGRQQARPWACPIH